MKSIYVDVVQSGLAAHDPPAHRTDAVMLYAARGLHMQNVKGTYSIVNNQMNT